MFVDTSGLLCILDINSKFQKTAVAHFRSANRLFTNNYVLAELIPLANSRKFPRHELHSFLATLQRKTNLETLWVDAEIHRSAMDFLSRRLDKDYSLCDAVAFLQMTTKGDYEALTTDRHFEQEGFVRLLKWSRLCITPPRRSAATGI
jgi:uncharacterized protein